MSVFEIQRRHLREILLYFFSVKKSTVESHRLLVGTYSEAVLSETCRDWFRHFKSDDFHVEDKECAERPKLIEDTELEASLDENPYQIHIKCKKNLQNYWELLNQPFSCV